MVRVPAPILEDHSLMDVRSSEASFSGWLVCGNARCGQFVAVLGKCRYSYSWGSSGQPLIVKNVLAPAALHPTPPVIVVPEATPQRLREELCSSFGLLWANGAACANRLRVVLEMFLEDQGFGVEGAAGKRPLPARIEALEQSILGVAGSDKLMHAVRIVGNVGSHEAELTREQLLDAYDWLGLLLTRYYSDDELEVERRAAAVVASGR